MVMFDLKRLLMSLAVVGMLALVGCNSKKFDTMVLAMCKYIPDHGLREDAEYHLTPSYFNAYSEAWDAPRPNYIGDEEFLFYFVNGQDGEPIFSVKSVTEKGDSVIAKIYIEQGYDGVPWDESEKTVHTLKLVRDGDTGTPRYLIDDFDNTKQECLDFVKKIRSEFKSGEFERNLRENGASSRDINAYRRELRAFYAKYGKSAGGRSSTSGSGKSVSEVSRSSSPRRTVSFSNIMDVDMYLMDHSFTGPDGMKMTFTGSREMVVNGTVLTGAMTVDDYNSSRAILRGESPYSGGTMSLLVDAGNGTITNMNKTDEVFRLD